MQTQFNGCLYSVYDDQAIRAIIWGTSHKIPSSYTIPKKIHLIFIGSNIFSPEHYFQEDRESSLENLQKKSFQTGFTSTENVFLVGARMLNKVVVPLETNEEYADCIGYYQQLKKLDRDHYIKLVAEGNESELCKLEETMPVDVRKNSREREHRMSERLNQFLKENKDLIVFACVGAFHVCAQNNMLNLLKEKGWIIKKIELEL